ncbi:MAG: hypothetical protein DI551_05350 [Micavibrio aeruginosavorus]|uniref:Uncharacterized protein n=1 Tax=Micavibrio aeruginosavorus TaxID=349221 RepID=A0A2W5MYL4_9BACT|nr:MAG: hypothetical protein DI551_05350 [Micavibrio aeruginosavorus]
MLFKELLTRLRPANSNINYMEVKELSERVEAAREAANYHVKIYLALSKQYDAMHSRAMSQTKKPRKY